MEVDEGSEIKSMDKRRLSRTRHGSASVDESSEIKPVDDRMATHTATGHGPASVETDAYV